MANKSQKKAARVSATRKTFLVTVAAFAFTAGTSEVALAKAMKGAGGAQDYVRREALAGRIASILAARGDNRDQSALIKEGYAILDKPGLNSDQPKRRTKAEHDAWNASKVWLSGFMKRHGITSTAKNAGNSNAKGKTRKPRQGSAQPEQTKAGLRPIEAAPTVKTREDANAFVFQQAAMLLAFINKNAKIISNSTSAAVTDFHMAMKAVHAADNTDAQIVSRIRRADARK